MVALTPTENAVKAATIKRLIWAGALVIRVNSGAAAGQYTDKRGQTKSRFFRFAQWFGLGVTPREGQAGISDIIALYKGVALALEQKRPGCEENVTEYQRRFLEEWQAHGGLAAVVSEPGQVDEILARIDQGTI